MYWADGALFAALIRRLSRALRRHRLVNADTILRWHHRLATKMYLPEPPRSTTDRRGLAALVVRMARENRR
jgi:hypothetical protein